MYFKITREQLEGLQHIEMVFEELEMLITPDLVIIHCVCVSYYETVPNK
jgi:hypothetical protein